MAGRERVTSIPQALDSFDSSAVDTHDTDDPEAHAFCKPEAQDVRKQGEEVIMGVGVVRCGGVWCPGGRQGREVEQVVRASKLARRRTREQGQKG